MELRVVPVTVVEGKVIVGFNRPELLRALGLQSHLDESQDVEWMSRKFQVILTAAVRATRQIPDTKLDWSGPERQRTLRQFTHHIFDQCLRAIEAHRMGRFTPGELDQGEATSRYPKADAIAQFGERALAQTLEFFRTATPQDLQKPVESHVGAATIGQLMDLALGHSGHHLKQLYDYLRQLRIEPARPLSEKEFEGIAVPTQLF